MARSSVKSIFSAVVFTFLGMATAQSSGTTVTICDPDHHQDKDLQAPTSGYIQSQNYSSPSPNTDAEACTVKLKVDIPATVRFIVDGNFSIPNANGDNPECAHNSKIWIGGNEHGDINTRTFCGTRSSGYVLHQTTPDSQNWQNGITIGFRFITWMNPRPQSYFRIKYAVASPPATTDSPTTPTTTEHTTHIPVTAESTTNTKESSSTLTESLTSEHLTSNTVTSVITSADLESPPASSVTKATNNTRTGGDNSNLGQVDAKSAGNDSVTKIGVGVGSGVVVICAVVVVVVILVRRKPTWNNKAKASKGESQAELDLHVYDDPAHLHRSGVDVGSTVVSPRHRNDKGDSEDASYSKLEDCYTAEVISKTTDPGSGVQDVYSNVERKTQCEEAEYYNAETITRVAVEATLQDTYSSVLVSNKASTESTAAVRTTELVDNDLYGS